MIVVQTCGNRSGISAVLYSNVCLVSVFHEMLFLHTTCCALSQLRVVGMQAGPPCFWFGRPSSCRKYLVMASVTTSLAATSLISLIVHLNLHSKFKASSRGRRCDCRQTSPVAFSTFCDFRALEHTLLYRGLGSPECECAKARPGTGTCWMVSVSQLHQFCAFASHMRALREL